MKVVRIYIKDEVFEVRLTGEDAEKVPEFIEMNVSDIISLYVTSDSSELEEQKPKKRKLGSRAKRTGSTKLGIEDI